MAGAALVGGISVGAALMYLLDPDRGRRRRALVRDKAKGLSNDALKAARRKSHDLKNRAQGLLHETWDKAKGSEQAQTLAVAAEKSASPEVH
jgi:hypothetical protein